MATESSPDAAPALRLDGTTAGWDSSTQTWMVHSCGLLHTEAAVQVMAFLSEQIPRHPCASMLVDLSELLHLSERIIDLAVRESIPQIVTTLSAVAYVLPHAPALHPVVYRFRNQVEQHIPAELFSTRQAALAWLAQLRTN